MIVIPISGKAGHGKDTLANYMKTAMETRGKKVLITHYGDLVKYVCQKFFDWDGCKDVKGRTLLQHVGTDIVRVQSPDYWVTFIKDMLTFFNDQWDYVLIPDTRFPNEVECLAPLNVLHIRIYRPGFSMLTEEQQKHPSETALDDYQNIQFKVQNDHGLTELHGKAITLTDYILENCR